MKINRVFEHEKEIFHNEEEDSELEDKLLPKINRIELYDLENNSQSDEEDKGDNKVED